MIHCKKERVQRREKPEKALDQLTFNLWFNMFCLVVRSERAEAALF